MTGQPGQRDGTPGRRGRLPALIALALGVQAVVLQAGALPASAQQMPGAGVQSQGGQGQKNEDDVRPYDEKLSRLSELLGSIHFLRELCGANEGQQWRERMKDILDVEGTSALRRARLTRSFNTGWRLFSRTYSSCTPSAQATVQKFLAEASTLSEGLSKQP